MTLKRYGDHPAMYFPYKALAEFLLKHNGSVEAAALLRKNENYKQHYPWLRDERAERHVYVSRFPLMTKKTLHAGQRIFGND
jgi:hypothetical protein